MKFCYNTNFTLRKQSQRSRSILQDGSRSLGLFWKEKKKLCLTTEEIRYSFFRALWRLWRHCMLLKNAVSQQWKTGKYYTVLFLGLTERPLNPVFPWIILVSLISWKQVNINHCFLQMLLCSIMALLAPAEILSELAQYCWWLLRNKMNMYARNK